MAATVEPGHVLAESTNFLLPNATFFAELVAFAIVLWVIYRYVVPPVRKAMDERQAMIRKQVEDSQKAEETLKAAKDRYDTALAEARTEAAKIRDTARADGDRIREEMRDQAGQEVARIRQRGEEQLASEREQVVRELRGDLGGLAVSLAGRIVGEELSDDERRTATVDSFLAELDDMPEQLQESSETPAGASRSDG
jgi:F-type H+-transporting ATPase subunit b